MLTTIGGDLRIEAGSFANLTTGTSTISVGGSVVLYGQGDLRSVNAVAGDIVVDGTAGDLDPYTLPSVTGVAGNLVFANSGASGTTLQRWRETAGLASVKCMLKHVARMSERATCADMELTFTSIAGSLVVNSNTFNYRFPALADVGNAVELHVSGTTGASFASLGLVNNLVLDMPHVPFRAIFPGTGRPLPQPCAFSLCLCAG